MMAAALDVPVSLPATAGEGGAWGMAVLAAYLLRDDPDQSLPDYLDDADRGQHRRPGRPGPAGRRGVRRVLRAAPRGPRDRARRGQASGEALRLDAEPRLSATRRYLRDFPR